MEIRQLHVSTEFRLSRKTHTHLLMPTLWKPHVTDVCANSSLGIAADAVETSSTWSQLSRTAGGLSCAYPRVPIPGQPRVCGLGPEPRFLQQGVFLID